MRGGRSMTSVDVGSSNASDEIAFAAAVAVNARAAQSGDDKCLNGGLKWS
jgi:hypothetical protein